MRRVAITGIGAITPIGSGPAGLWAGVRRGTCPARRLTRFDPEPFPSRIAAEIADFEARDYLDDRRSRRLDRFSQLAVAATRQAIDDAALATDFDAATCAIFLGSALGGIAFAEEQHERYLRSGMRAVEPMLALSVFGGAGATNVAMEIGARGVVVGNANSCASGLIAIGDAFHLVRGGGAAIAFAGGAEAPLAPLTFGAFARIKAMTTRNAEPEVASRPFDRARDGFLMAEGAAVLVLEELDHARTRGVRPYAEIVGYGTTNDAYHPTAPLPSGREAARAMTLALEDGGLTPDRIDYVNAHATGTPLGDPAEARAIRLAFGGHTAALRVSGTKGLHGHALGASGAIEAAIVALVLRHGWLPPTANLDDPDPECPLRYVPRDGLDGDFRLALTNSFGFGGINASLVLRKWEAGT